MHLFYTLQPILPLPMRGHCVPSYRKKIWQGSCLVLWGTLAGSMLPLLLSQAGIDPVTASAPFVATLVEVTGLMMYCTVARVVLGGTLL